jgi:hypothetical protein
MAVTRTRKREEVVRTEIATVTEIVIVTEGGAQVLTLGEGVVVIAIVTVIDVVAETVTMIEDVAGEAVLLSLVLAGNLEGMRKLLSNG